MRGIDGRQLAVLEPLAGLHVQEVIEEAAGDPVMPARLGALRRVGEEPQRRQHALPRLLARDVATLDADRIRREPKADCGDARVRRRRIAVRDQAVLRIGGLPEEAERTLLQARRGRGRRLGSRQAGPPVKA